MTPKASLALCGALLLSLVDVAGAAEKKPDPLTMKLSAPIAVRGADVVVRARVEPDARSRELVIEWVADDLSGGSHVVSLEGAKAAITHQYALRNMAAGEYVVTAILRLSDGTEIRRESKLAIYGMGEFEGASGGMTTPGSAVERLPVPRH
jgi:hypothetical protein